jgi:hypothetical protein
VKSKLFELLMRLVNDESRKDTCSRTAARSTGRPARLAAVMGTLTAAVGRRQASTTRPGSGLSAGLDRPGRRAIFAAAQAARSAHALLLSAAQSAANLSAIGVTIPA